MELDLIQRIKEFKPTESYILTFSIDLHYYESLLLPLLQENECTKNVVIADSNKVNESIEHNVSFLNKLGREYILIPIHAKYAFHPKIYIFKKISKDITELLCFVGSGNLTYPGLNTNQEIFCEEIWGGKGKAPSILKEISDYFNMILYSCRGESAKLSKIWLNKNYPQLFEKASEATPHLISYPNKESIFDQFMAMIGNKQIKDLFLTAPFFDADLSALKNVIKKCNPRNINVLLQPGDTVISTKRLLSFMRSNSNVNLSSFKPKDNHSRYLHAKMVIAADGHKEYAMVGSANISDVALFGNARIYNYEANIYQFNPTKKSILDALNIEELSNPLSLDELREEGTEKIFEKPKLTSLFEIISAECYGGNGNFIVSGGGKHKVLNVELLYGDRSKKEIAITKGRDEKDIYVCDEKDIFGALSIRVSEKGIYSKWTPILFVGEIDRRSKRYFSKAEKLKDNFLRATNELEKDNYLDQIIDSLIDDTLKNIESRSQSTRSSAKKSEPMQGMATIGYQEEPPLIEKNVSLTSESSFTEGLDYVISALREQRHVGFIEEDVNKIGVDKEFEEYDKKHQEATEDKGVEADVLYGISRRLRLRRRMFLRNESIKSPFARSSFYSLIALPHIPKLNKLYIGDDKEKYLCVEGDEWNQFVIDSCIDIGKVIFKSKSKEIWPDLNIDVLKKDVFGICVSSIAYSIATIYPFIKNRNTSLGDEGYENCLLINRLISLLAALVWNYLHINGSKMDTLGNKFDEIRNHFPCGWVHVEKSILEVLEKTQFFLGQEFKKPVAWEFGELVYMPRKGFILNTNGRSGNLWA